VEKYLTFAQGQAQRRVPMYMKIWIEKLNGFLTLNDREILNNAGSISHEYGELVNTTFENNLTLYAKHKGNETNSAIYNSILELSTTQQINLGLIKKEDLDFENKYWLVLSKEDFVKKYPNSIRTMQVKKDIAKEEELKRIAAHNKALEDERNRLKFEEWKKKENKESFFNIGFQGGTIGKYGIVMEGGSSDKRLGFRMSVRGSFIFGENVKENDYNYLALKDTKEGRFSIDVGTTIKVANPFYLYAGVGFGESKEWILYDIENKYSGSQIGREYGSFNDNSLFLKPLLGQ